MKKRATSNPTIIFCFLLLMAATLPAAEAGDRRLWPTKGQWRAAFSGAIRDPHTWAPAAGAAAIGLAGADERIARWAVRETPIFGSPESARRWSDGFARATEIGLYATAFGSSMRERTWNIGLTNIGAVYLGQSSTGHVTSLLKSVTSRERPDGRDFRSFPSGHTSGAFANAAVASRSLRSMNLPRPAERGLWITFMTLAAGTAWARVEGGRHYPSDVLAGAALGNFLGRFVSEAFLPAGGPTLNVHLVPDEPRVMVGWQF